MKTLNEIKADLRQHYGSETFTRHAFVRASIISEGALDYFEQAECFWLWDIIATEVHLVINKLQPDTHYFNLVSKNDEADLSLHDYQGNLLWSRHIDYTSHPEGEMSLIVGWDGSRSTTCLTSED